MEFIIIISLVIGLLVSVLLSIVLQKKDDQNPTKPTYTDFGILCFLFLYRNEYEHRYILGCIVIFNFFRPANL